MLSSKKAGKSMLNVPKGSGVLPPLSLPVTPNPYLVAVTAEGRMLMFPVSELPELPRGKGNKIIQVRGEDCIAAWCVLPEGGALRLYSGQRHMTVKWADLAHYHGARAQRGLVLPQGYRRVHLVEAEGA